MRLFLITIAFFHQHTLGASFVSPEYTRLAAGVIRRRTTTTAFVSLASKRSLLPCSALYQSSKNNDNAKEDDDPWAGNSLSTDDDDDDDDDGDDDPLSWVDDLPGSRDLSPDPKLVSDWKRGASYAENLNDNFFKSFDDKSFIKMQKEYSAQARNISVAEYEEWERTERKGAIDKTSPMVYTKTEDAEVRSKTVKNLEEHLELQEKTFGSMADFFDSDEAVPAEVRPVLTHLTRRALKQIVSCQEEGQKKEEQEDDEEGEKEPSNKTYKILDVGCGTGALFPFYLEAADREDITLSITGLDLTPKMISKAESNAKKLLPDDSKHTFDFQAGDFVRCILGEDFKVDKTGLVGGGVGVVDDITMKHRGKYDAVVINACFGNFYDQAATMTAASQSLNDNGILVISHPLGAQFVRKLNEEDPDTVPHHLPTILDFRQLVRSQPLDIVGFVEEVDLLDAEKNVKSYPIYYACAKKVPHRLLLDIVRLRGPVDEGYGRGGKKLGFPTANLPSSLFADALENVSTGVYFGWAVIEDRTGVRDDVRKGRNIWHKAVVNVGYSPTFDGEENKEKIVEAHLILDDKDDIEGDFYNETMRLALSGFLRPEMKFDSFPDLVKAINNDVANAKEALSMQPFASLRTDSFLTDPCKRLNNEMVEDGVVWVGNSGGNENASYEFQEMKEALLNTPMGRWAT